MGTRSLTVVLDEKGRELVRMYRQFDGYPDGHGQELADFLKGKREVNGYSSRDDAGSFNGAPCLAASMVAHFKKEIGGFYLYPAGTTDCGEEYVYTIKARGAGELPELVCAESDGKVLYSGPADGFAAAFAQPTTL